MIHKESRFIMYPKTKQTDIRTNSASWRNRNFIMRQVLFLTAIISALPICAVAPTQDILNLAVNYQAYPYPAQTPPELSPAPDGYKPFHIEHYGRHGSRWHIGTNMYERPVEYLEKAKKYDKLTPRGELLLERLITLRDLAKDRDGELTPLGAEQHRGIARRMYHNFPEIFQDSTVIDARSTVVIRCILSMENELRELHALNPNMTISSDASEADMHYLNYNDTLIRRIVKEGQAQLKDFNDRHKNKGAYLQQIINDAQFAKDSIDSRLFFYLNFYLANTQSHGYVSPDYDLFTKEELMEQWRINNADWYVRYGNSPASQGKGPYTQRNLLRNIIERADEAIQSGTPSANLRFGHEVCVVPLVVLMELDDYGVEVEDFEEIEHKWKNYEIFPMAANVQMIFYRNESDPEDVIVKVLLNEREVSLPVTPFQGAYYRWNDLKSYYQQKLDRYQ